MASFYTRYLSQKLEYAVSFCRTGYQLGSFTGIQAGPVFLKFLLNGDMTYLWHFKISLGEVMNPSGIGTTLLIRKLSITAANKGVFVGDVVAFYHPEDKRTILVRKVAATEGCEMLSTDKTDDPFVLEKNHCWVLASNENVKPKEANDSRTFGPIMMASIIGRAIYIVRSRTDHGTVQNSQSGMQMDLPVLAVELDFDEMVERHESGEVTEHEES